MGMISKTGMDLSDLERAFIHLGPGFDFEGSPLRNFMVERGFADEYPRTVLPSGSNEIVEATGCTLTPLGESLRRRVRIGSYFPENSFLRLTYEVLF